MPRFALLFCLSFSAVAFAGSGDAAVAEALDLVKEAQDEASDAGGACRRSLKGLDGLADKLASLERDVTDKGLARAKSQAEDLSDTAKDECKGSAAKRIRKALDKAVAQLERAQDEKPAAAAKAAPREEAKPNVLVTLAGGIGGLFGGASNNTTVNRTETHSSKRTEEINGRSIDDDDDDAPAPAAKKKSARGGFQATCRTNADCESNTCFVGKGELGYCTKMCNSWSECPSFWECKAAANAPQNLCMQK
jgi:hypothetical protein